MEVRHSPSGSDYKIVLPTRHSHAKTSTSSLSWDMLNFSDVCVLAGVSMSSLIIPIVSMVRLPHIRI